MVTKERSEAMPDPDLLWVRFETSACGAAVNEDERNLHAAHRTLCERQEESLWTGRPAANVPGVRDRQCLARLQFELRQAQTCFQFNTNAAEAI
jgi:hypothetical protein